MKIWYEAIIRKYPITKNNIKILFFKLKIFFIKKSVFPSYDMADDIITSLEIIEKLLFPETDFWRNNYLKRQILEISTELPVNFMNYLYVCKTILKIIRFVTDSINWQP